MKLIAVVQLTLFTMVVSAPASSRILTTFLWFRAAATWRAVSPACKQSENSLLNSCIGPRLAMLPRWFLCFLCCLGHSPKSNRIYSTNMKFTVKVLKRPPKAERSMHSFIPWSPEATDQGHIYMVKRTSWVAENGGPPSL